MPETKTDPETLRETVKALLRADAIRPGVAPDYSEWDEPPEFRYFLDYDEEADALNVMAVATNYEMDRGDGPAHELFRDPTAAKVRGRTELSGFGATFPHDNSGVSWVGMDDKVLGLEIDEDLARRIHPKLFHRIDG